LFLGEEATNFCCFCSKVVSNEEKTRVKMREDVVLHIGLFVLKLSGGVFASLGIVIILLCTPRITLVCNK
jgi:hypothetical protein